MKWHNVSLTKKGLGIFLIAVCIVLVSLNWPRNLSQLIPLSQVSDVTVFWCEKPFSDMQEEKAVELNEEKIDILLEYLKNFTLQPCAPSDNVLLRAPVYHVYFITESAHIEARLSEEGVVEIDGKYYRIRFWNTEDFAKMKEDILAGQADRGTVSVEDKGTVLLSGPS